MLEIPYEPIFAFEAAHNTQSRSLIATIKNNPEKWFRWEAQGALLGNNSGTDVFELIRIELKAQFEDPEALLAEDDPYAYKYNMGMMPDIAGLTSHLKITVINGIASL